MSCGFQKRKRVCGQKRKVLKAWDVEEDDEFGLWIWGWLKAIEVAGWAETTDAGGTWRGCNGMALGSGGDFAVVADAGRLAPDNRTVGQLETKFHRLNPKTGVETTDSADGADKQQLGNENCLKVRSQRQE
jgi:hypothetical protein